MKTLLFLSLFLLCFPETISLLCNTCLYAHKANCFAGQGTCTAQEHGWCAAIVHYKGGKHLYSQQLCKSNCVEEEFSDEDEMNVTLCCQKHLCNIF